MTVTNDENDEIVAVGYWKRRLQLLGLLLVLSPMILRIPLVSNFIKDVVLLTINEATPYHIEVENCLIRPAVLGVQLDNIVIDDATQTLVEVESVFVGVKIPWDGQILRTLIVDSPKITVDLDLLPEQPKSEGAFEVPALPRVQVRSGTVQIVSKTGTIDIPNINLTHTQGRAQLWIEDNALIESGDRKVLISPFQWNDIVLENGDAWIQDINVESSIGSLYGNFGVEDGLLQGAIDSAFDLSTLELHPKWDGKGYLYATVRPSGDGSNPKFGLQLSGNQFSLTRQATTRTFTYQFDSLNSQFLFKDGVLWIENMTAGWAGGQSVCTGFVDVGNNDAQFKVIGQGQNLWELGQDLDLSSAPWLEMQLDSELTLSGTLNPLNLSGDIAIDGADFGTASGNIRQKEPLLVLDELDLNGAIQLSKTTLQYQLDSVRLQSEGSLESTGKIEGIFEFPAPNNMIVDFDFTQLDLTTLKPLGGSQLGGVAKGGGRFEGPMKQLSLTSRYHVSNFSMLGLSYADSVEVGIEGENLKELTFDIDNAQKGASTLTGTMLMRFGKELWMEGQFDNVDARANNLMGIFFDPLDVDAVVSGVVNVSGVTSNLHVEADFGLSDVTLWGEPFDTGRFRLSQDAAQLTIEEFSVERNDGLGSAWMRGTRKDGLNNFEVIVGGLPVEYLTWVLDGKYPVRGKVDFLGTIRGEGFVPNGRLRIRDMWHGVQPLGDANLLLHSQTEGMVVQGTLFKGVHIEGLTGFSLDEDYIFDVQLRDFPIEAINTIVVGDDTVSGLLNADGQIWQRKGQFGGAVELANASLSWRDRWLNLATSTSVEWDGVQGRTSPIHIVGSGKTDLTLHGEKTGHRHLVQGSGTLDMSVIEMVLEGTERASGVMEVAGEWTEEGMDAELKIENGFLQGSWFPHPIESIYSDISMLYEDVQIRSWDSVVGGGAVSLVGTVDTEEFLPSQYNLELSMNQSRIQLLDWLPPVVGSGDFRVTGDAELPLITGSVVASEMTFVDRIGWEGALLTFAPEALTGATEEELEPYFEYAIDFTAQDTIRIRNNLADMSASASLKFVGNMASPGMLGSITLTEGGRVLFKERDFDVLRGTLRYEDASTFDPLLDIALETSVITPEREVEIRYFITGLYSDWQTHTASTPALPQADINALLLFGMTRRELETEGGLGAALAIEGSDLVFSKFGASQRFVEVGSGIFQSELLRLDRVDIVSGPTDRNSAYVSSALRLLAEKDIGNGTLRLEQNITDTTDVFVSWEQRLTQRLYTRLYWSSLQQGRTINGNGAVGAEFEVQWELD